MENLIFRLAAADEMPCILDMQRDIFCGEQGIPGDSIDAFMSKEPICWCAVSAENGKICAATAAWKENGETHWGRFIVIPEMRGRHIGTELARFSFEELFAMGVEKIHMEARDSTVKIVCRMGGEITGQPFEFFKGGNVTPVVLEKKNYIRKV